MRLSNHQRRWLTAATIFCLLGVIVGPVRAETLESNNFVIQFSNFNIGSGTVDSANYNLTETLGQTAAGPYGQYGSSNSFVGSGFQYIYQIDNFSFEISKLLINLGTLTPNSHNTDSHTLSITSRGAGGYTVYAYELRPLQLPGGGAAIPDTTCDAGTCTTSTAGIWIDQTIPGFGYNMSGHDIPATFASSSYFRPFADQSLAETMQVVMSSDNVALRRQSTVTYKGGVAGDQAGGNYETGVAFVAVPGF